MIENIGQWIFKIIYMPIFIIITMMTGVLVVYLLKEVGWEAPYRWLVLIAMLAYIADHFVNK